MIDKDKLAKQYFPHLTRRQAVHKLWRWISLNAELCSQLASTGYRPKCRSFTPTQVRMIYEKLGEPEP